MVLLFFRSLNWCIEQDNLDGAVAVEIGESEDDNSDAEEPTLAIIALLKSYKEAVASNDESKITEIEAIIKSIEDEKNENERKVVALSEELSSAKERVLRISADFDNFRKRTERERAFAADECTRGSCGESVACFGQL